MKDIMAFQKIGVGVIGCGAISKTYLDNLSERFSIIHIVGVADLIEERAQKAAEKYHCKVMTNEEIYSDPEISIVVNLTNVWSHYEVSKAALEHGKHVYSEKMMAEKFCRAKELYDLAQKKGVRFALAPDTFLGGGIQTCRKLIDEGLIGEVVGGRCVMASHGVETWHPDPDFYYQRGGGPLFDMGPYYITALINLLGGIKSVYGYHRTAYQTRLITAKPHEGEIIQVNTPTHIESFLTFDSGVVVSLLTSFDVYNTKQTNIEIYGTKGTLYVPDPNCFDGKITFYNGETRQTEEYPLAFDYGKNSRCLGLADMAKSIETGNPSRTTCKQTFHVLETMASIMKSAELQAPVALTSHFEREAPMDPTLPHGVL